MNTNGKNFNEVCKELRCTEDQLHKLIASGLITPAIISPMIMLSGKLAYPERKISSKREIKSKSKLSSKPSTVAESKNSEENHTGLLYLHNVKKQSLTRYYFRIVNRIFDVDNLEWKGLIDYSEFIFLAHPKLPITCDHAKEYFIFTKNALNKYKVELEVPEENKNIKYNPKSPINQPTTQFADKGVRSFKSENGYYPTKKQLWEYLKTFTHKSYITEYAQKNNMLIIEKKEWDGDAFYKFYRGYFIIT